MLHVIHLLGEEAGYQAARDSRLIREGAGAAFPVTVRRIGRGGDYRHWAHAALALRFGGGPPFDLIHVWDTTALIAALAAATPTVFTAPHPLTARDIAWLRFAARRHN